MRWRSGRVAPLSLGVLALALFWCEILFPPAALHYFEAEVSVEKRGVFQIYYHRGAGLRESESVALLIGPSSSQSFQDLRIPLPIGKFRALRIDPTKGPGVVRLRHPRIVTFDGRLVREFSVSELVPNEQITVIDERDGTWTLTTTAEGHDPQLLIEFRPVLRLGLGFWSHVKASWARWLMCVFAFAATALAWRVVWHYRNRVRAALSRLHSQRPAVALAALAVASTAASSYPVVFLGRSFVSPSSGVALLYSTQPSMPGQSDTTPQNGHGADIGAMMWQHFPYMVTQSHVLRTEGVLPLWNRYNSVGATALGQGQSMLGNPLVTILCAIGVNAGTIDCLFLILKALFAFGLGWSVWLFTRDFLASGLLVVGGAFIAFFNYRVNHPAIFSLCYAPLILCAWLLLAQADRRRHLVGALTLWLFANWSLLTSGTVKEAYILLLTVNGAGFFIFAVSPGNTMLRRLVMIAAGVAFVLLSAPLWLTFLDALNSGFTVYTKPIAFQARRAWLAGFFDDLFYRAITESHSVYVPATNFVFLLGTTLALLQPRRLFRAPAVLILLGTTVLCLLIAFEWAPPDWIAAVPLVRNIHHVNNVFSLSAIVPLAVVVGWGFASARSTDRGITWPLLALTLVISALLFAFFRNEPSRWTAGGGFAGWTSSLRARTFFYTNLLLTIGATVALLLCLRSRWQLGRWTKGTGIVAMLALACVCYRHGQHAGIPDSWLEHLSRPGARTDLRATSPAIELIQDRLARETPARVSGSEHNLVAGFSSVYGFEGINGADAVMNPYYREFALAASLVPPHDWFFPISAPTLAERRPIFDFLNLRYVVTANDRSLPGNGYETIARLDLDVLESPTVWPRAFFTDRVLTYDSVETLLEMIRRAPAGEPFAAMQASDSAAISPTFLGRRDGRSIPATHYKLSANATQFAVRAPASGLVVLHEAWLPDDFVAEINGQRTSIVRVNHFFKGVVVPNGGDYEVTFRYQPRRLPLALTLAAGGAALFAALLFAIYQQPAAFMLRTRS